MENVQDRHVDLNLIEEYLRSKKYPEGITTKGEKANFRSASKKFSIVNGQFQFKGKRLVITDKTQRMNIIQDIHQSSSDNPKAIALASHLGRKPTYEKVAARFYWYTIVGDIGNFIKSCDLCQRQQCLGKNVANELHSVPVPSEIMKQIGVDLCILPEVDGLICIDYFSKWSEAKPIEDKSAATVAQFLYELICRHGCLSIQINNQGREFVNAVAHKLQSMTGAEQRVTSAYRPQSNGLVVRQNRTIKTALVKVLDENPDQWSYIIEGVLFAHRVSRHNSTKYSPFHMMYNLNIFLFPSLQNQARHSIKRCLRPF